MQEPGVIAVRAADDAIANEKANRGYNWEEWGENEGRFVNKFLHSCKPPLDENNPWCAAHVSYRIQSAALNIEIEKAKSAGTLNTPHVVNLIKYRENLQNGIKQSLPPEITPLKTFCLTGYTPNYKEWALKTGNWIPVQKAEDNPSLVKKGDLICFYFSAKGRIAHIGIVIAVSDDGVTTIEGNTSPPGTGEGVNREGDGLYRKWRSWGAVGSKGGFVRVPF